MLRRPFRIRGRSVLRALPLVVLALLSCNSWLEAQGRGRFQFAEIRGQIVPVKGQLQLPRNLSVSLTWREGRFFETQAVSAGSYSFKDLADGNYILDLSSPGYETTSQSVTVDGSIRGQVQIINLVVGEPLDGGPDVPVAGRQQTISAGQLALPKRVGSHLEKADQASREGKTEEAIKHFEKALKIEPNLHRAWNNLSVQYLKADRIDSARRALRRALEFEPNDLSANYNMGVLLVGLSEFRIAIEFLQRLVQLDPDRARARALLAECYLQTGYHELALRHFKKVLNRQRDNAEWLLKIGDCYTRLGQFQEAILSFQRFLARAPDRGRRASVHSQIERLEALLEEAPS